MKFIAILTLFFQFISCQEKTAKDDNHFQINGKDIFYNEQKVYLGMPIEEFTKIVNSEYRIAKDATLGGTHKDWYWMKKLIHATTSTDKEGRDIVSVIKMKKYSNDTNDYIDDLSESYKDYSSIEEVIKKYGKYDSIKVEEIPNRESTFYVFDKLGFNVAIDESNNTISQINLYPLSYNKIEKEYRLTDNSKGPQIKENSSIHYVDPNEKWKVENYQVILERHPKTEFKGKFTYNGNTADFSKIGYTDWDKMVSDLHIGSSDYDPPGDSKRWSRQIREDFDACLVDIQRYNNEMEDGFSRPTEKAVGKIDGVQSIEIYRFTDE